MARFEYEQFMDKALAQAQKAFESKEVPIGAVITTAGNNLPAGTSGWGKCNINMLMNQVAMILCLT